MSANSSNYLDIFLSHSGDQKLFVEYLFYELQSANYRVFFDQDTEESLPKGSPLLTTILDATEHCKLGVVVISDSFIKSLWPMMELQHLMANPSCIIYPVFYELQPGDLVKDENLKIWQECWKDLVNKKQNQGYPINIDAWCQALQGLRSIAGTRVYAGPKTGYIPQIVSEICNRLPPPTHYEDVYIKGREHSVQVIEDCYKFIAQQNKDVNATSVLLLGVEGVGGLGKTTLCKTMVNFYNQHKFPGRSCLLELPTTEIDRKLLIKGFKVVLSKVTHASPSQIKRIQDIDEAISIFKHSQKCRQFFLALDNVSDWTKRYIQQILDIVITHFPGRSTVKIIVTSRSEALLKSLFINVECKVQSPIWSITTVPGLQRKDALDALLSYSQCLPLYNSSKDKYENDITSLLDICFVNRAFHPLLLKTFGNIMSQMIHMDGSTWRQCIKNLTHACLHLHRNDKQTNTMFDIQNELKECVIHTLEFNYSLLQPNLKDIFLDVAILYQRSIKSFDEFLLLYKNEDVETIKLQVLRLEYFGFCKLHMNQNQDTIGSLEIHDLYRVLTEREAKTNGCFLVLCYGLPYIIPPSLSKVTRILHYCQMDEKRVDGAFLEIFNLGELKLEEVEYLDVHVLDIVVLYEAWKSAKSTSITITQWICEHLSIVGNKARRFITQSPQRCTSLSLSGFSFNSLSILKLECGSEMRRIDGLSCAPNLQSLEFKKCYALTKINGLSNMKTLKELILDSGGNGVLDIPNLSGCTNLFRLVFYGFGKLKSLSDLQFPPSLESLDLGWNPNLVDAGNIGHIGNNLVDINIDWCGRLKDFTNVELGNLKRLNMRNCAGLEMVTSNHNLNSLEELDFLGSRKLRHVPSVGRDNRLRRIEIGTNYSFDFKEVNLGATIQTLDITLSKEQLLCNENHVTLSSLTNLERLQMRIPSSLVSIDGNYDHSLVFLGKLQKLTELKLFGRFDFIESLKELSCLTNLQNVVLRGFTLVKDLDALSSLTSLQTLDLEEFTLVKDLDALSSLTNLHFLTLKGFTLVKDLDALSPLTSLDYLVLREFTLVKDLDVLSLLTNLTYLELIYFPLVKNLDISISLERLKLLGIAYFNSLESLSFGQDLSQTANIQLDQLNLDHLIFSQLQSHVTNIRCLDLFYNNEEDVGNKTVNLDLSCFRTLEGLSLDGCPAKAMVNLKWPLRLEYLQIRNSRGFDVEKYLPSLLRLTKLSQIEFSNCQSLQSLRSVSCPTSLTFLLIENCESLEETPDLSPLKRLKFLSLRKCNSLERIPGYENLSFCEIEIEDCEVLEVQYSSGELQFPSTCKLSIT